jgi:hypothetical protein
MGASTVDVGCDVSEERAFARGEVEEIKRGEGERKEAAAIALSATSRDVIGFALTGTNTSIRLV